MKKIDDVLFSRVARQSIPFELISFKELYDRFEKSSVKFTRGHRVHFHALIIVTGQKGTHTIDFDERPLYPGVILPLVKSQVHAFSPVRQVDGYILSLEEQFITDHLSSNSLTHFQQLFHYPTLSIEPGELNALLPLIELIVKAQQDKDPVMKVEFISSVFMALVYRLIQLKQDDYSVFTNPGYLEFIRFKNLIGKHYQQFHNAKDYAGIMNISYNYLNTLCKAHSGKTAKAFIDNWVVLEAKRKISENQLSIQEVAFETGFEEPSNFSRFFRKMTNTTPKDFAALSAV